MADENTQAVAEATVNDNAGEGAAEAAPEQAQHTGEPAAKAPGTPRTLEEVMDDPGATQEEIEAAANRGDELLEQRGGQDADDSGAEKDAQGEQGAEEGDAATEEDAADDGEGEDAGTAKAEPAKQPKRIKPGDALVVKMNDLIRGGMTANEALAFLSKQQGTAKAEPGAAAEAEAKVANPDPLSEKLAKLADMQRARKEARDAFDSDAEETAQVGIDQLNREIARLESKAETQQESVKAKFEAEVAGAVKAVSAAHADFFTEGTPLMAAMTELESVMTDKFFQNPEWPKELAVLAWRRVNPGQPIPNFGGRPAVKSTNGTSPTLPVKKAVPTAMLAGGSPADGDSIIARGMRRGATQAEIEAAAIAEVDQRRRMARR